MVLVHETLSYCALQLYEVSTRESLWIQTNMDFTARQLQKKCQDQTMHLNMTFVDHTKALDTVSRDGFGQHGTI